MSKELCEKYQGKWNEEAYLSVNEAKRKRGVCTCNNNYIDNKTKKVKIYEFEMVRCRK